MKFLKLDWTERGRASTPHVSASCARGRGWRTRGAG